MKTPDYSNLHKKTFLDFTDDPDVIKEILYKDESREDFLKRIKGSYITLRYNTFMQFCYITKNSDLSMEVQNQLGKILEKALIEANSFASKHGLCIDVS